ncbi:hypothetical protein RF11_06629 [Thelohanellus kitauei]|uniref:Uncharacterized protein n=1 Tax=Thelohanellus kitauei TaxID=669202 RepID=A0A0C2J6G6_THEKT|nr:hypothetical protein RF11_06629 [Thelohanellus kitauei]
MGVLKRTSCHSAADIYELLKIIIITSLSAAKMKKTAIYPKKLRVIENIIINGLLEISNDFGPEASYIYGRSRLKNLVEVPLEDFVFEGRRQFLDSTSKKSPPCELLAEIIFKTTSLACVFAFDESELWKNLRFVIISHIFIPHPIHRFLACPSLLLDLVENGLLCQAYDVCTRSLMSFGITRGANVLQLYKQESSSPYKLGRVLRRDGDGCKRLVQFCCDFGSLQPMQQILVSKDKEDAFDFLSELVWKLGTIICMHTRLGDQESELAVKTLESFIYIYSLWR